MPTSPQTPGDAASRAPDGVQVQKVLARIKARADSKEGFFYTRFFAIGLFRLLELTEARDPKALEGIVSVRPRSECVSLPMHEAGRGWRVLPVVLLGLAIVDLCCAQLPALSYAHHGILLACCDVCAGTAATSPSISAAGRCLLPDAGQASVEVLDSRHAQSLAE
jgi:Thylakoid formation protein